MFKKMLGDTKPSKEIIDTVMSCLKDLDYILGKYPNRLNMDAHKVFKRHTVAYEYGGTTKKGCNRYDWALCKTNYDLEGRIEG